MADDKPEDDDILTRIHALIETEHHLRSGDHDQQQLREVEAALDQCWDLLRQRRARQEFGQDPTDSQARSSSEVESYLQ